MFQGHPNAIQINPSKSSGINLSNNEESIKISNLINIEKTKKGHFRSRRKVINVFKINNSYRGDNVVISDDVLKSLTHNDRNGNSKILLYSTYFSKAEDYERLFPGIRAEEINRVLDYQNNKMEFVGHYETVDIDGQEVELEKRLTTFRIKFEDFTVSGVLDLFRHYIYNDVKVAFSYVGGISVGYVSNFEVIGAERVIRFDVSVAVSSIRGQGVGSNFTILVHRAAIYEMSKTSKDERNSKERELIRNLAVNVFISSINYKGVLLIVNGIDPNMRYDGRELTELTSYFYLDAIMTEMRVGTDIKDGQPIEGKTNWIQFAVEREKEQFVIERVPIDTEIELTYLFGDKQRCQVQNLTYEQKTIEHKLCTEFTMVVTSLIDLDKRLLNVLYKYELPIFGFITVSRDRFWSLPGGRSYKNRYKDNETSMFVYYSFKRLSIEYWSNPFTNAIDYINCSTKSDIPDSFEAIYPYREYLLFVGRNRTQVWRGESPVIFTRTNDVENFVNQSDDAYSKDYFEWKSSLNVGILHQYCLVPLDNEILFINYSGLSILNTDNRTQNLTIDKDFNERFADMFLEDYENVKYESDYRKICGFNYEYYNTIGFKIHKHTYLLSKGVDGFLTKFTGEFSNCINISYDYCSTTLFLTSTKGKVGVYNDKVNNNSQDYWLVRNVGEAANEFDETDLFWTIKYDWFNLQTTWYNEAVFLDYRSNTDSEIAIRIYLDNYLDPIMDKIIISRNVEALFGEMEAEGVLSYMHTPYTYVNKRFSADALSFSLSGTTGYVVLKNIIIVGSNQVIAQNVGGI